MKNLKHLFSKPAAALFAGAAMLAVPVSLAVPSATAEAQSRSADLDRAVRALRAISTMRADFTQTDRAGNVLSGELTLRNPGRIRFEYGRGANMLVVSDGKALTLVDYEVNQVERWPISNSPLGALLNPNSEMSRYGTVESAPGASTVSIRVRDPNRPEFGAITLIFTENGSAPGNLQLTNWVAIDSQNNRTTVRLRNHRYGVSVPDSAFTYRDPRRSSRRPG